MKSNFLNFLLIFKSQGNQGNNNQDIVIGEPELEDIIQDEEMSDIPQNVLSVNLNDINNNIDVHMSEDYNDDIHSENIDIDMNLLDSNNNNSQNNQNSNNQNPQNNN